VCGVRTVGAAAENEDVMIQNGQIAWQVGVIEFQDCLPTSEEERDASTAECLVLNYCRERGRSGHRACVREYTVLVHEQRSSG